MIYRRIRRVLLAWELGGGMGHATRLLKVAKALRENGVIPIVAAANSQTLKKRYQESKVTLIAAPKTTLVWKATDTFKATSYSDILGIGGFADQSTLQNNIAHWRAILDKYQPDLIIADYAPILTLACYNRFPVISFGDGFVVPHASQHSFPILREGYSRVWSEDFLFENAISAMSSYTTNMPNSLPEMTQGQEQFLSVIPELDIYGNFRNLALGALEKSLTPMLAPKNHHLFVYLSANHPLTEPILNIIAKHKISADCLINGINHSAYQHWKSLGIKILTETPAIKEMLFKATVCIHHGGINLSEECILAGRFQFVLPKHFEQRLNANRMLHEINSCIVARHKNIEYVVLEELLTKQLNDQDKWIKALDKAVQVSKYPSSLPYLLDKVSDLLT